VASSEVDRGKLRLRAENDPVVKRESTHLRERGAMLATDRGRREGKSSIVKGQRPAEKNEVFLYLHAANKKRSSREMKLKEGKKSSRSV